MRTRAKGTLVITNWDEQPFHEIDAERKLRTTNITQTVHGDIEGQGAATWLTAYKADGSADYLGFQRIDGKIGDAEGSIVLRMTGGYDGTVARSEWNVVEGSGTRALEGMTGAGVSVAEKDGIPTYELDYDLP